MRRLFILAILLSFALPAHAEKLTVSTERSLYVSRHPSGEITGLDVDLLKIVFNKTGVDYELEVLPWARAFALAETQPMNCTFPTARTPEREPLFKWVSSIREDKAILVARADKNIKLNNLEEAKNYTIGTQRNDYYEALLKKMGFTRLDLGADFPLTFNKLASGRIDMMPVADNVLNELPKGEYVKVITLIRMPLALSCNKSVPDELIAAMQKALDELIADGTQRRIHESYGLITDSEP